MPTIVIPTIKAEIIERKHQPSRYGNSWGPPTTTMFNRIQSATATHRTCQIYLGHTNKLSFTVLSSDDKNAVCRYCVKEDKSFYVHAPVNANLAGTSAFNHSSYNLVGHELKALSGLPCSYVLHVGSSRTGGTIANVADAVNRLCVENTLKRASTTLPYPLLLEVSAGQKNQLGVTFDEFRLLYEALDKGAIGVCVDTQHIYASGLSRLESFEDVSALFSAFQDVTGKEVSLVHLNDSARMYDSHVDRHEALGRGYIWGRDAEGLVEMVKYCHHEQIDMVTETHDVASDNKVIASIMKGLI